MMTFDLNGKSVVITGAGNGIGRASALLFAEHGAAVFVSDIDEASANETAGLIEQSGGTAKVIVADVTNESEVNELVSSACELHGTLDIMFNNAGGAFPAPLDAMTAQEYKTVIALNLDSVFYGSMAALKLMRKQGGGCILSTTSGAGYAAQEYLAVYGAAKAGVINFMRSLAVEYGAENIRANTIMPGPMVTPGLMSFLDTLPGGPEEFAKQIPSGRLGTAQDIAEAAVFLASDSASYINGALIPVDGAIHAKLASPSFS